MGKRLLGVGDAAGAEDLRGGSLPGLDGVRGRIASRGAPIFGTGVRTRMGLGGLATPDTDAGPSSGRLARFFLYSRQHVGQRHSTTSEPSGVLKRESLQPNCALMRV